MEDGRIVERGPHDELIAADGAYRKLYDSQFTGPNVEPVARRSVHATPPPGIGGQAAAS